MAGVLDMGAGAIRRAVRVVIAAAAAAGASCAQAHGHVDATTVRLLVPAPNPSAGFEDFAARINQAAPDLHVTLQGTAGSVVVTSEIQRADGEAGVAQADVVYQAYRKGIAASQFPHQNLRGIAVGGLNRLCVYVRRDAAIDTIGDLRGKRVGIPPIGTAGELFTRMVLDAYGVTAGNTDLKVHQPGVMGRFFAPERLDAMILLGTFQPETVVQPVKAAELRLVPIPRDMINRLRSQYPFVKPTTIQWHDGHGAGVDVQSVGADSLLICRRDLPDEIVYRLTKTILSTPRLRDQLSIDTDTAPATPIPLHPGAARYYRELQLLQ